MPKLPVVKPRAVVQFLQKHGFVLDHASGSHFIYYHPVCHGRDTRQIEGGRAGRQGVPIMKKTRPIPIEQSSGNVYDDLRYPDPEDMLVKARLVAKIADIIRQRGLTQAQAARLLRLTQPRICGLLKGQFSGISERRLLRCLTRLGRDVEIRVKPASPRREGRLTVYVA